MNVDEKISELILQATKERSHYYVGSVLREIQTELARLRDIEFRYESCSK